MALPDFTTQDPATYKASIDAAVADHDAKINDINDGTVRTKIQADCTVGQSLASGVPTLVQFNAPDEDTLGELNTSTGVVTPTEEGYYFVEAMVTFSTASWSTNNQHYLWIGGGAYTTICAATYLVPANCNGQITMRVSGIVYCNGSTHTIRASAQNGNAASRTLHSSAKRCSLTVFRVL